MQVDSGTWAVTVTPFYHRLQIVKVKYFYVPVYELAKSMYKSSQKKATEIATKIVTSLLFVRYTLEQRSTLHLNLIYFSVQNTKITKNDFSNQEPKFGTRYHMNYKNYDLSNLN